MKLGKIILFLVFVVVLALALGIIAGFFTANDFSAAVSKLWIAIRNCGLWVANAFSSIVRRVSEGV